MLPIPASEGQVLWRSLKLKLTQVQFCQSPLGLFGRHLGKCIQYVRKDFYIKKPSKPLQSTLFYALVSIICGGKPLITTNKLAGPVGKKGVLGGVYRL